MSGGREAVLGAIRRALGESSGGYPPVEGNRTSTAPPSGDEGYGRTGSQGPAETLDLLHGRIADYEATVVRSGMGELAQVISRTLEAGGIKQLVVPSDLPGAWIDGVEVDGRVVLIDGDPAVLTNAEIAASDGVITGCALAIAETGTLVLDGGKAQGRRVLTLLPDYHLCVVFQEQIVESVPEAMGVLSTGFQEAPCPITLISGPSATSDIELIRVEGVHGPRTLNVILVTGS